MRSRRSPRLAALVALLAAAGGLAGTSPAQAAEPDPVRVLIIGDSVAQGSAGDWTWRYRLWQHLDATGADIDLVGPRRDLYDVTRDVHGSQDYADPRFDRDHAARWGMLMEMPDEPVADLVERFRPDVVVETRGLNDFVWLHLPAAWVLGRVEQEIAEIRSADPEVDVVLARLPQTWWDQRLPAPQVGAYNAALGPLATELSTPGSRVVAAATGVGFVEGIDTWDPAHLSARGEVKMAAGVADALAVLGVAARYPRPLPKVVNGHWRPASLAVTGGDGRAWLSWVAAPGIPEQYVWLRDVTAGERWARLPVALRGSTWAATGLVNGHVYEFRLQASKGSVTADSYSPVARVRPAPPPPGRAPAVSVAARDHGIRLRWPAVAGATSYTVGWRGPGGSGSRRVAASPALLDGLRAGGRYRITVTATNLSRTPGPSTDVVGVPTGPRPRAVTQVRARHLGARAVRLSWREVPHATRYVVWQRRAGAWHEARRTSGPAATIRRPGPGTLRVRVRSWHQEVPGGWSRVLRIPPG